MACIAHLQLDIQRPPLNSKPIVFFHPLPISDALRENWPLDQNKRMGSQGPDPNGRMACTKLVSFNEFNHARVRLHKLRLQDKQRSSRTWTWWSKEPCSRQSTNTTKIHVPTVEQLTPIAHRRECAKIQTQLPEPPPS